MECLWAYAVDGDAAALGQLIDRHAGWITAAARRRLGDEHLAEDAAQAVFLLLASKAVDILQSDRASIAAWLFHAMHLTCCRLGRARDRRECHEAQAQRDRSRSLPRDELRAMLEDAIV